MRITLLVPITATLSLSLGGCLAKTAYDVVTLPVKAAGQGIDWATTSQEEADRNYGRKMRKQEAREGRELKKQHEREEAEARRRAREERHARDDD